ncbi:MAG: type II toxin-antitoxin system PemK/MazF family toxin [Elusimicrobia bacterium]|nr:type II toxin-antitoxin system PemK/MazF family toxin [Elusimicrobiota bacterium]
MRRVKTGEVYFASLEPVSGSEQGRTRPVIIFQNPNLARFTSTAICIPLTTNTKRLGLPGTCLIHPGDGGLAQEGVALGFQLRALDVSRLGKCLGRVSAATIENLANAVLNALGIVIEP